MKPVSFDYHRPQTVTEAVAMLDELYDAKVLAGGQSLVPLMNFRLAAPANLIDISRLEELARIEVSPDAVLVGAAVTHSELHDHSPAAEAVPLLREAESLIAHEVIRNRGTVCGSLAHADPSGELTAVLMLLGGSVQAVSVDGTRVIAGVDLFEGPLQSSLAENELIVEAVFPRPGASTATAFREVTRRHGDYAVCGVAVAVDRGTGTATPTGANTGRPGPEPCSSPSGRRRSPSISVRSSPVGPVLRSTRTRSTTSSPLGSTRRATCTVRPTTVVTSPGYSPVELWRLRYDKP